MPRARMVFERNCASILRKAVRDANSGCSRHFRGGDIIPASFEAAHTVALKKSGRANHIHQKHIPITPLNTLENTFELVMARKITHLAEFYWLLPHTQREAPSRKIHGVSIELLTE